MVRVRFTLELNCTRVYGSAPRPCLVVHVYPSEPCCQSNRTRKSLQSIQLTVLTVQVWLCFRRNKFIKTHRRQCGAITRRDVYSTEVRLGVELSVDYQELALELYYLGFRREKALANLTSLCDNFTFNL